MSLTLSLCWCLAASGLSPASPPDRWFAADKLKHFFTSGFVQSASYSAARLGGLSRSSAGVVASVSTVTFGVGKEVLDRRRSRPFSVRDLVWDAAGALAAAALLNGTR